MNRRTLLSLAPAAAATLTIGPHSGWAQGTPGATPVAEATLPVSYAEVAPLYEAARERALTEGRTIADQIFGGEFTAIYDRSSPELQSVADPETLAASLQALTTNRISFAADSIGFYFDGQLMGDTIEGFMVSDAPYGFSLTRAIGAGSPIAVSPAALSTFAGDWTGVIYLGQEQEIAITLTFGEDAGTLSLPDQGATDLPLTGIAFDAERPIGERLHDQGMPLDHTTVRYWAQYGWGDRTLGLTTVVLEDGTIVALQIAPEPLLPPDPAAGFLSDVAYRLPFAGLWWVYWGGDWPLENYHSVDPRQRHAVDLLIWNEGATYRTDGAANSDYWVYGEPVLAPTAGTVTEVQDGIQENTPGNLLPDVHPGGNHVTIQTAQEEFIVLAHLQPGTLTVGKGDAVTAGQVIGLAGNSGNSSEPHLHIHLQNEPNFFSPTAVGLPLVFTGIEVNGEPAEQASLEQGSFVNQA